MSLLRRLLRLAWEALLVEVALYRSLARWVVRRPDVPAGTTPIGHGRLAGPMLWLWIVGSAAEVVVLDLVLHRWVPALRLPVLVVGVWGVLWMLGLLASTRVRPHLLGETDLVVRTGARTYATVPLAALEHVRGTGHAVPGMVRSLHEDDGLLLVAMGSETNLELVLAEPMQLATSAGPRTVSRVGLWVDDPREVAARLRNLVRQP
jgi:hypothetical protein